MSGSCSGESDDDSQDGDRDRPLFRGLNGDGFDRYIIPIRENDDIQKRLTIDTASLSLSAWRRLGELLRSNVHLEDITLMSCNLGVGRMRLLFGQPWENRRLHTLKLYANNFGPEGATILARFLQNCPSLRILEIPGSSLGLGGITVLVEALGMLHLETLDIRNNNIGDAGVAIIVPYLISSGLESLVLGNNNIGRNGCLSLGGVLENEACSLTSLRLNGNVIDDEGADTLARSLSNNTTLQEISLEGNSRITKAIKASFSRLVCNTSSLESIYSSNHTLNHLGLRDQLLGVWNNGISCMLGINREHHTKGANSRRKIAASYLVDDNFDVAPFVDINVRLMPHVLSWIGSIDSRDRYPFGENDRMYLFLKNWDIPSLFGVPSSSEEARIGTTRTREPLKRACKRPRP